MIYATEMGIGRALSAVLGKKGKALKPLPTFDEMMAQEKGKKGTERKGKASSWVTRFEKANKIGRYATEQEPQHGTQHTNDPVQDPGG